MQITITHDLDDPLVLPVNYNHIIQSIIYHALEDYPEFADAAHNDGFSYEDRKYKVFTFSNLKGHYILDDKKIIFDENVSFEIRSPFIPFINVVGNHIADKGLMYGERHIRNVDVEPSYDTLGSGPYRIRMTSPICVYSSDPDTGWTEYYSPFDEGFYRQIKAAFQRKYLAYTGSTPGAFDITPFRVDSRNKVITRYKENIIEAWSGEYLIEGDPEFLTFLYDSGIGSKNPAGFGMFDVIDVMDCD